jgi:HPt (histidine-containing phosphotransfer) domain-containing protein
MEGDKAYDLSYLEEISGGDNAFVQSMVSQFIVEAPDIIKRLHEHAAAERWDELYFAIHKFAPNLAFVGLTGIRIHIDDLEDRCKHKLKLNTVPGLVSIIGETCEFAVKKLKEDFSSE